MENCSTCIFGTYVTFTISGGERLDIFKCRRFPPTVLNHSEQFSRFPRVARDTWCGEYKVIPELPIAKPSPQELEI